MLRKKVLGNHKKQKDTVTNWFASDQQGDVKKVLNIMVKKPDCPVELYGGRSNVRLVDYEWAKEFSSKRGGETEWL